MSTIVVDPGHGGAKVVGGSSPNNATGPAGTLEKTLTLEVGRRAAQALQALGHQVTLTRTADNNLGLSDRAAVAKGLEADAFVSIHFNGFDDPSVQGTETWVFVAASAGSRALAACVQEKVLAATGYRDRGVQSRSLGVLDPARHDERTAACLAEISFMTDPADEQRLKDAAYLQRLGQAVAAGVGDYLRSAPKRRPAATPAVRGAIRALKRAATPRVRAAAKDGIEHVVVLMLENRSFDQMLGGMRAVFPELDGVDPARPGRNVDPSEPSDPYFQAPTFTTIIAKDPKHGLDSVRLQLDFAGVRCGGFVHDYRIAYGLARRETQEVMGYYAYGTLPAMHELATHFTICDRWFSSVPGPTWTNRLFALSGTAQGRVAMPHPPFDLNLHRYNQDSLFDRLSERGISWRIYYGDVPQSLILEHQRIRPSNAARYRRFGGGILSDSFAEKAAGPAKGFPAFAFIEPNYFLAQNDQHPPNDVMRGDLLIARIYNALRANEELWSSTLFVVLHDEHGGFYDHVYPGPAVPPDGHREEYTFDQYGVRVPALLVSPWVGRGPLKTEFDHTSLLRYLTDKWGLGPLGARVAHANSIAPALLPEPRPDTPESLPEPSIPKAHAALASPATPPELSDLQRALLGLTDVLEVETDQPSAVKAARSARMLEGPTAQADVATDRVERFLQQQRAKSGVGR